VLEASEHVRPLALTRRHSAAKGRRRRARGDGLRQSLHLVGEPLCLAGEPLASLRVLVGLQARQLDRARDDGLDHVRRQHVRLERGQHHGVE
jgi:hypothetical protein